MTLEAKTETDLLIIGAGIAGCMAAIALADKYHITLIDKRIEPVDRIGESLAPAAHRILKQLHLFNGLNPSHEIQIYRKNIGMQSYWGSNRVQIEDHMRNPDGPGININRKKFEKYLRKKVLERGVRCAWPLKLYSSSYSNYRWEVIAQSNSKKHTRHQISARFVVDATGRRSHFARSQGVNRRHYDKLISCWASMPDYEENKMSTISASESGWWYSAVVPNNKRVLAYHTDSDLIDRSQLRDLESFLSMVKNNKEVRNILDKVENQIHFHGPVSANSTRLDSVAGHQWMALGDAAISFDPLSSQGMFHAMASAMQFKDLVNSCDVISSPNPQKMDRFQVQYSRQIDEIWNHYLHHRAVYYGAEERWAGSPFWQRRHRRMK